MMRRIFALSTIALGMAAGACGLFANIPDSVTISDGGTAPTLCDGPIRIRALNATDSLTVADVALPVYLGALDYLREINETGGIRGCMLDWEFKQVAFGDPTSAVAAYEAYRAEPVWNDVVAFFGISSADTLALGPRVQEDRKVLFSMAYNGTVASPVAKSTQLDVPATSATFVETTQPTQVDTAGYPYVFFPGTDYSTAMRIAMYYVATLEAGARVGFVGCRSNEFCINPLNAGKTYAKNDEGLLIGRPLYVELTDRAEAYAAAVTAYFAAEGAQMGVAGYKPVSWLWAGNLTAGTFFLGRDDRAAEPARDGALGRRPGRVEQRADADGERADHREQLRLRRVAPEPVLDARRRRGGVQQDLRHHAFSLLRRHIDGVGPPCPRSSRSTTSGARATRTSCTSIRAPSPEAGVPAPTTRSVRYVQGHMSVELLKAAIEKVADLGQRVTGETLKNALETFRSYDTGGLTAPLSFTAADHRPQSSLSVYQVVPPGEGDAGFLSNVGPNQRIPLKDEWLGY